MYGQSFDAGICETSGRCAAGSEYAAHCARVLLLGPLFREDCHRPVGAALNNQRGTVSRGLLAPFNWSVWPLPLSLYPLHQASLQCLVISIFGGR
jgi:hypothetical protein